MDQQKTIGLAIGGGVGFVIGIIACIKYSMDNANPGPNPLIQTASVVVPVGVGAGVGYLAAK